MTHVLCILNALISVAMLNKFTDPSGRAGWNLMERSAPICLFAFIKCLFPLIVVISCMIANLKTSGLYNNKAVKAKSL